MALALQCPGCKVRLTVSDETAGETFPCPRCDRPISVPMVLNSEAPQRGRSRDYWSDIEGPPDDEDFPRRSRRKKKQQSRLGVASFILSVASGVSLFVLVAVCSVLAVATPGGMDEKSPEAVLLGLAILAFLAIDLLALGLGIAGVYERNRNKLFAILGIIFSAVTMFGLVFLIILGNAIG